MRGTLVRSAAAQMPKAAHTCKDRQLSKCYETTGFSIGEVRHLPYGVIILPLRAS